MASKGKTKGLGSMKHSGKGPLHHIEIHPAKNSDGSAAFTTKVFRGRTPEQEKAMSSGKYDRYVPEVTEDKDSEVVHGDGVDMVDHVKRSFGVKDEDDEEDEGAGDSED